MRQKKGAHDVCKIIPGLMDNVGKGVRCCDTRLCVMRAARAVRMDGVVLSRGFSGEVCGVRERKERQDAREMGCLRCGVW